ncbi:LuxR family transcriptional regulator [Actibacterium sp. D379-3]
MTLDDLEALFGAHSVEEVCDTLIGYMGQFGFDRVLYGFTRFCTETSLGDLQDSLVLTNYPEAYTNAFIHQGLYFHAPMVRWAAENVGACSWSWIEEEARLGRFTGAEEKVVQFNHSFGVRTGYTISFKDVSSRAKGAIGLAARDGLSQPEVDAIWREHGRVITAFANTAHLKLINLPHHGSRRPLTRRQREALEWVGDGKTTQDIAMIMGLTAATVEKHLRLAREALNVETTAQAVLKASYQNQIFVIEPDH